MKVEFVVSQVFHGAGLWIVHLPNPNRLPKLGWFDTQEQAQGFADYVNAAINAHYKLTWNDVHEVK